MGIGDDAGRIAAVRAAAGPEMAIRVDANGAWGDADEAVANLRALAPAGLEYAEEPVHGVAGLRAVRAAGVVPVAMDETAAEPGAAGVGRRGRGLPEDRPLRRHHRRPARRAGRARGGLGGLRGVDATTARSASPPACTWPRRSAACAWCGLATLGAFAGHDGVLAPEAGSIAVPAGPGLLAR